MGFPLAAWSVSAMSDTASEIARLRAALAASEARAEAAESELAQTPLGLSPLSLSPLHCALLRLSAAVGRNYGQ